MDTDRRFDAYQQFVLDTKIYWTREMYPQLRQLYERELPGAKAPGPTAAAAAGALIGDHPLYRYFAWFERHLQRMKYSGRFGLVPHHERFRAELEARLASIKDDRRLELNPDLELPKYYTSVDIHQHPGGVWSDEIAGFVYERGARSTTPLLDRDKDLHYRFMKEVMQRANPSRLIDLGCGFGKSTRPFYTENRDVEVVGAELSAPCLKLAALTAREDQAENVRFVQRDAADTGLPRERFDAVTSTMLLHEMPPPHIEKLIAESYRLLAKDGMAIHLDFIVRDDPFKKFIHYTHGRRNNEPFMEPLNEMDIVAAHKKAGFRTVEIVPFEEMPGTLAPEFVAWRFPWTMIIAQK